MKLLVQQYLETHTFGDLERDHGIYCSFSKSGHKFSLNYDMIQAKDDDLLAQECRGLILAPADGKPVYCRLDEKGKRHYEQMIAGETKIICYGLKRFFNYGQGAAKINLNDPNLLILSKEDGTLIQLYFDPFINVWCVSTRSVPEADILMNNGLFTFRTLFEKALLTTTDKTFDQFTANLNKRYTYCFELTSPINRVVVQYHTHQITLIAIRDLSIQQEMDIHRFKGLYEEKLGVPVVKSYPISTIEELVNWVSTLNPLDFEGIVLRDSNFNRIKVKNAQYIAFNKLHDTLISSPRNCLELILGGKDDDVIAFLPEEIANNLKLIKEKLQIWLAQQEILYLEVKSKADQILVNDKKTFALTLNNYPKAFKPAFFHINANKSSSIRDYIENNRKGGTWAANFLDQILSMIQ